MKQSTTRRIPLESWVLLHPPAPKDEEPLIVVPAVKQRGYPLIAWMFIVLLVGIIVAYQALRPVIENYARKAAAEDGVAEHLTQQEDVISAALEKVQVRYLIGAGEVLPQEDDQFLDQLRALRGNSVKDRLRFVVYTGELVGPQAALRELNAIESAEQHNQIQLQPRERELLFILYQLYGDYAAAHFEAPSVSASERRKIQESLGWAGELALAPKGVRVPDGLDAAVGAPISFGLSHAEPPKPSKRAEVLAPARKTFLVAVSGVFSAGCFGFIGAIGLMIVAVMAAGGRLHSGMTIERGNHGIYAETFALWLMFFIALIICIGIFAPPQYSILLSLPAFFVSLLTLLWPVVRGIPWEVVRQEIGWTWKSHPVVEVGWGVAWYVMSLPFLVVGLLITLGLMFARDALMTTGFANGGASQSAREAAHPIVGEIATANGWTLALIFVVAAIAAPIVEETMFRGVLYRHLREATGKWSRFWNIAFSVVLVSFIFAVIHPQGLLALPLLMALAIGFNLAREWRGSLIPCMVAHGVSNALVLTASVIMMRGG